MAQPLIKFFRVAKIADLQATQKVQGGLYFETSTGILYVYNGTDFEAYSGLKSASFADQKLVLTPSVGDAIEINLSGYVDSTEFNTELGNYVKKDQTIAGIDLRDNITAAELKTALGLTDQNLAGEANKIEVVKVNGTAVEIKDKAVDITVPTKLSDLTNDGNYVTDANYVHTDNNYTADEKTKLAGIEAGAEVNIIETVKVNGVALVPGADRAVDVVIPDAAVKGVVANDPVITLDGTTGLLSSSILLSYKSKNEEGGDGIIKLTGKDGADLGQIDATEFIKDGMIDTVAWSEETGKENYLVITWNTDAGKQKTEINFGKYVDTWTHRDAANGIKVENNKYVGVVDPASENFLAVGEAGFKLSGVQTAIGAAAAKATTVVVEGTDAGNNLSIAESKAADGHSIYTVNLTDVASAKGLSDLAKVVNDNEHVTAAALTDLNGRIEAVADSIPSELGVMSVAKGTDGKFVTTTIGGTAADPTVGVAVSYTSSTAEATALATDAYVQEQIAASALTWQLF